jgi:hypothetical protein
VLDARGFDGGQEIRCEKNTACGASEYLPSNAVSGQVYESTTILELEASVCRFGRAETLGRYPSFQRFLPEARFDLSILPRPWTRGAVSSVQPLWTRCTALGVIVENAAHGDGLPGY